MSAFIEAVASGEPVTGVPEQALPLGCKLAERILACTAANRTTTNTNSPAADTDTDADQDDDD